MDPTGNSSQRRNTLVLSPLTRCQGQEQEKEVQEEYEGQEEPEADFLKANSFEQSKCSD